jgi:hypothetical protein
MGPRPDESAAEVRPQETHGADTVFECSDDVRVVGDVLRARQGFVYNGAAPG